MNVSKIFIERPVASSVLFASILFFGWLGFVSLPVNDLPNVDFPTINVTARLPGASPEVMTSSVTAPLEKQFGQVSGLTQMTSVSTFGSSLVTLQFSLDLNIDQAEQQVQAAINAAANLLPNEIERYRKAAKVANIPLH